MIKSYKGGYSILDTTPFTFELETSSDVLNDDYIAEQLLEICKPHFAKFTNELKPIYIRYLTDDYAIGVALATMNHTIPDEFEITAQIGTNNLEIAVKLAVDSDTGEIYVDEVRYTYLSLKQNIIDMNENGDITLGTKLYSHTLIGTNTNPTQGMIKRVEMSFISNDGEEVDFIPNSSMNSIIIKSAIAIYDDEDDPTYLLEYIPDDYATCVGINISGGSEPYYPQVNNAIEIENISFYSFSDTVTPL